jgi:hypothetical protein
MPLITAKRGTPPLTMALIPQHFFADAIFAEAWPAGAAASGDGFHQA